MPSSIPGVVGRGKKIYNLGFHNDNDSDSDKCGLSSAVSGLRSPVDSGQADELDELAPVMKCEERCEKRMQGAGIYYLVRASGYPKPGGVSSDEQTLTTTPPSTRCLPSRRKSNQFISRTTPSSSVSVPPPVR